MSPHAPFCHKGHSGQGPRAINPNPSPHHAGDPARGLSPLPCCVQESWPALLNLLARIHGAGNPRALSHVPSPLLCKRAGPSTCWPGSAGQKCERAGQAFVSGIWWKTLQKGRVKNCVEFLWRLVERGLDLKEASLKLRWKLHQILHRKHHWELRRQLRPKLHRKTSPKTSHANFAGEMLLCQARASQS